MRLTFLFLLLCTLTSSVFGQKGALSWYPSSPVSGSSIQISYTPPAGKKYNEKDLQLCILEWTDNRPKAVELTFTNKKGILTTTYLSPKGAKCSALAVRFGDTWDNNNGEGFYIPFYDQNGKYLPGAIAAKAALYRDYGMNLGLDRNAGYTYELYEESFKEYPDQKLYFLESYIRVLLGTIRGEAGKIAAINLLDELSDHAVPSENLFKAIAASYDRLSETEKAIIIRNKAVKQFPNGWSSREALRLIIKQEANIDEKIRLLQDYQSKFNQPAFDEKEDLDRIWISVLRNLSGAERFEEFVQYSKLIPPAMAASTLNQASWKLAEKGENLAQAEKIAALAVEILKNEKKNPSQELIYSTFLHGYLQLLNSNLAACADTYSFILEKQGNIDDATKLQQLAIEANNASDSDMNERLVLLLEAAKSKELLKTTQAFIENNQSTEKIKSIFTQLYSEKYGDKKAKAKIKELEDIAHKKAFETLKEQILDKKAPLFTLKNLNGNEVVLENLQGKIVILDFWATWCGPCKASFPGMQKAVENFKSDTSVVFLFVDTWENGEEKEKNAAKFIQEKGYTFQVIMDNDNQVISKFGVSGIPTKYIVDKNGIIRFKSIGYAGSPDKLVEELTQMIEITKTIN